MYARVVSFSSADAEKRDRWIQTVRDTVVPTLSAKDGFAGYIALYDEENGRAKGIILWESQENAEAAEQQLTERRRQVIGEVGLTEESSELYEAPVVELGAARV